jgi:predicted DNA-binding WGR domain protein
VPPDSGPGFYKLQICGNHVEGKDSFVCWNRARQSRLGPCRSCWCQGFWFIFTLKVIIVPAKADIVVSSADTVVWDEDQFRQTVELHEPEQPRVPGPKCLVDGFVPNSASYEIFQDCLVTLLLIGDRVNNQFYIIQLLERQAVYSVWTRWGRVGEPGQTELQSFTDCATALAHFKQTFYGKTGNNWEDRANFVNIPGRYQVLGE